MPLPQSLLELDTNSVLLVTVTSQDIVLGEFKILDVSQDEMTLVSLNPKQCEIEWDFLNSVGELDRAKVKIQYGGVDNVWEFEARIQPRWIDNKIKFRSCSEGDREVSTSRSFELTLYI